MFSQLHSLYYQTKTKNMTYPDGLLTMKASDQILTEVQS